MINATINIILDTRRAKKDGTYPTKLRVIYERKYKDYAVGLSLTEEDFAKVSGAKPRGDYKDQKLFFSAVEQRAKTVVDKLPTFSFEAFERALLNKRDKRQGVYDYYTRYIEQLKEEGRGRHRQFLRMQPEQPKDSIIQSRCHSQTKTRIFTAVRTMDDG